MKISHLPQKFSVQVTFCFEGHYSLNQQQRTCLLYLQSSIGTMTLFRSQVWKMKSWRLRLCREKPASFLQVSKPHRAPPWSQKRIQWLGIGFLSRSWRNLPVPCLGTAQPERDDRGAVLSPFALNCLLSLKPQQWDRAPLGTSLLHSLLSPSSSQAAEILLQSHSLSQPLEVVLC